MQLYQECGRSCDVRRGHAGSLEEGEAWRARAGEAWNGRVNIHTWRGNVRLDLVLWLSNSYAGALKERWTSRREAGENVGSRSVAEEFLERGSVNRHGAGCNRGHGVAV